jgi:RsiW-degrading membrane proteinase PrsW (M82 family)
LALSGVLPALLLMALVERLDARRPEPRALLRRVALWGALSTVPAVAVETALGALGPTAGVEHALYAAFVVAALTEETVKALVLYRFVWREPAFDERLDGIVYATRAGLGFAMVENVLYLFDTTSGADFLSVFVMRAVFAVPGHAISAGFMGYWAARRRFDGVGPGLAGGLAVAIALHGAYDASLFLITDSGGSLGLWTLALLLVPFVVLVGGYRRLKAHAAVALRLDDAEQARAAPAPAHPFAAGFALR